MLRAALAGELDDAEYRTDPVFGLAVPLRVPGVDAKLLDPRGTWRDPDRYDEKARALAAMFRENFETRFADVDQAIRDAGPRV
jgi:phosphoenolpyruvate carboxykinase (ATP)